MDPGVKLCGDHRELLPNPDHYRDLVGKRNYLNITSRDISFATNVVSQFMSAPQLPRKEAVFRIVKHLGSTVRSLFYQKYHMSGHLCVEAFIDLDWASGTSNRKSTTGYCVLLGGNLVTWKSKKLTVVARFSAEVVYRAMTHTTCEIVWVSLSLKKKVLVCNCP